MAEWAARRPTERAAVLRRAGLLFEEHAAEIQDWIVRESGAIPPKAQLETHVAAQECFEASALSTHPRGEVLSTDEDRWSMARRRPVGVVSVIAPFNFPLILSIRAVAPALALGNAVLLKPDPRTSVCGGVVLARVFEEAGLPAGLLSLLPGGADVGAAVVEAPEVSVIAFTGSTEAGRKVGEAAARHLKRAHLELGGNNALVVLPGADVAQAASAGAFGSFMHQGQICMTSGRHLVHESIAEEYVAALAAKAEHLPVGDPASGQVALGPIIDEKQPQADRRHRPGRRGPRRPAGRGRHQRRPVLRADRARGRRRRQPGLDRGDLRPGRPGAHLRALDEAVALVNENAYGLSVGILGDVGLAMQLADRVSSGKVHINEQTVSDEATAPFGGTKSSGNGSRVGGATANLESLHRGAVADGAVRDRAVPVLRGWCRVSPSQGA